jgi:hypothetical protein
MRDDISSVNQMNLFPEPSELAGFTPPSAPAVPKVFRRLGPNGGSNYGAKNFYTPPEIIEVARTLMGGIDLDPCSDTQGQLTVQATQFYTSEGLTRQWGGRVFCNPPGSTVDGKRLPRGQGPDAWFAKGVEEADQMFYVSFSLDRLQTSQRQAKCISHALLCWPTFIPSRRIAYLDEYGVLTKSPPKPSCFTWKTPRGRENEECVYTMEAAFKAVGIQGIAVCG